MDTHEERSCWSQRGLESITSLRLVQAWPMTEATVFTSGSDAGMVWRTFAGRAVNAALAAAIQREVPGRITHEISQISV